MMPKPALALLSALALAAPASGATPAASVQDPGRASRVPYWSLAQVDAYGNAGLRDEGAFVATTGEQFARLWARMHSDGQGRVRPDAAPPVDFQRETVVFISAGTRPGGGTSLQVSEVEDAGGEVRVRVQLSTAGAGCMVTAAITTPVAVIRFERRERPVKVLWTRSSYACK